MPEAKPQMVYTRIPSRVLSRCVPTGGISKDRLNIIRSWSTISFQAGKAPEGTVVGWRLGPGPVRGMQSEIKMTGETERDP